MEGMVANCLGDYRRTKLGQIKNSLFTWRSLLEWTSYIPITIW
jgi:hypothetical protein